MGGYADAVKCFCYIGEVLYWNAFQPGSSMDVRSRELGKTRINDPRGDNDGLDWDARVKDRISKLTPAEIGYRALELVSRFLPDPDVLESPAA